MENELNIPSSQTYQQTQSYHLPNQPTRRNSILNKGRSYIKENKKNSAMAAGIFIIIVLILVSAFLLKSSNSKSILGTSTQEQSNVVKPATKTKTLNKDFSFPIKDDKGNVVTKLKYNISSAELRDEIVVKGQKATAIEGKQFLVLNVKLVNESTQKIVMNTRDYLRLSINGNDKELLAPDIHNDPVEIQAISTKETRLGFPIDKKDTNLKLKVGEITGDKQTVDLKF